MILSKFDFLLLDSTLNRKKVRHSSLPDASTIKKRGNYRYKVKVQPDFDLESNVSSISVDDESGDRRTVQQISDETLYIQSSSFQIQKPVSFFYF